MKKYSIWLLALAASLAGACGTDEVDEGTLALNASSVSANKRGMTYEGGDVTFDVTSNVYWVINLDEDADWLTVTPRGAYGNQTVKITAAENPGSRRSTTLRFDSRDGVTAQIEVTQGSSDELIYYIRTGAGASAVASPVAVSSHTAWEPDGVGASAAGFSGVNAFVSANSPSSGYEGASGGNNIVLELPAEPTEGAAAVVPSFSVRDVATRDDLYFRLKMGVLAPDGGLTPDKFRMLVGNGGDELVALQYEVTDGEGPWKEVVAKFWIGEDNPMLDFKVEAPAGGYRIDDFRLYEGNIGEGQEIAFQVGGDDGKQVGYVYFEDDFSWVTDVYGGTDYVGTYPTPLTAETYWNSITAASHGQEAYNALVGSGWKTDDNKLKERVYLRLGYVKMGRGSNAAGCGGGLVSPTLDIRRNRAADLKVTFKCCIYVAANGTWDPSTMQVRVIGPGTINDDASTEKVLVMQTETPVQWEEKTLIVYGATSATQLVFESVEETRANRWFLDDVRIVKAGPDDKPSVELIPLEAPAVTFDQEAVTESSVKFTWTKVEAAAEYEYSYTCLNCGEVVASRSGKTAEQSVEFTGLIAGSSARLTVRALPTEGDKVYKESPWSDPVEGSVQSATSEDSHPDGYIFFEDDFSWVTAVYKGSDYISGWPGNSAETNWTGVTAAAYGEEAYKTFVDSGWTLGDNTLKQRTYLRIGYVKMGRGSNAGGSGGSLMTPALEIDEGCSASLKVTFDCCIFLGTKSVWDPTTMQVRIVGPGTIGDDKVSVQTFEMSNSDEMLAIWQSGLPDKNPWETKQFVVSGATSATRIIFESVEETVANRWFLDNVKIEKVK